MYTCSVEKFVGDMEEGVFITQLKNTVSINVGTEKS